MWHTHYEFRREHGRTEGFEIITFDEGNFTRVGDAGWHSWAFAGNYQLNEPNVKFFPIA
jgi:hypothetical protein